MGQLGRYALYRKLATGGMAEVYVAKAHGAEGFSRIVAVKRLLPQFAADRSFAEMFIDEGRITSRIHHPNVVSTLDVVRADGELFIVMEYVAGESLATLLSLCRDRGNTIPSPVVASICVGVLSGLDAAHDATDENGAPLEIVHRDVSPQNVMLGSDGVPRLLDFGVARATARLHTTRDGALKGKLRYMAPEAFGGSELTRRADVYALGIVLWELLTGKTLFKADTEAETMGRILEASVKPPSEVAPHVPAAFDGVVLRALERDPAARFESAREMAKALHEATEVAHPNDVAEWIEDIAGKELAAKATIVAGVESGAQPPSLHLTPLVTAGGGPHGVTHVVTRAQPSRRRPIFALAAAAALAVGVGYAQSRPTPMEIESTALGVGVDVSIPPPAPEPTVAPADLNATAQPTARAIRPPPRPRPRDDCSVLTEIDPSTGIERVKRHCLQK